MKNTVKILLISLFAFIIFTLGNKVEANSIQSISMDIFVDDKGDAYVTETWKCNVTQGTEVYHPYYNLGKSTIKDLTVTDGNIQYEALQNWKTSGTLESKANKSGINKISNGVELCWGISQYGQHTYIAKYTITNFIAETTDAQMIYWTLIPYDFSDTIGKAYIKIHTNFNIDDTIEVWGYGNYGGTAYVYDGYIEMQSKEKLEKDEYMTILVKFPLGTFNTNNKLNNDFTHYYKMAEKGAVRYKKIFSNVIGFLDVISPILLPVVFWTVIILLSKKKSDSKKDIELGEDIPKDIPYFRDIPCKKDIYRAYYIGEQYYIIQRKTDILGAIILKWLKDGKVRIEEKKNTVIVLTETNVEMFAEQKEKELFKMLYKASKDGYLESKELEKWCKHNYSKLRSWFDKILKNEKNKLIQEGLIELKETNKVLKRKKYIATPELRQEAIELAGLRKYLLDYTLISKREAVEVQLFEEYLIFAQIMGVAKEVAKQFKDIYPEIIEETNFVSYEYIDFVNTSATRGVVAAQAAEMRANDYSSGGGGFSSGGGGEGSFGGGDGGRRLSLKSFLQTTCQK